MITMGQIDKNFNLFNKCKSALRHEVDSTRRRKLIDILYKIKLYGELVKDDESLSEEEKYMIEMINNRKIPEC